MLCKPPLTSLGHGHHHLSLLPKPQPHLLLLLATLSSFPLPYRCAVSPHRHLFPSFAGSLLSTKKSTAASSTAASLLRQRYLLGLSNLLPPSSALPISISQWQASRIPIYGCTCAYWTAAGSSLPPLTPDRLILQAIQASIAGSIAPLVTSCATAAEAWNKLQTTLANRSRTRMFGLHSNLMTLMQEGSSVADYLQNIKVIIDDLALICHLLTNEEILVHKLNGLSPEYKELTTGLRARDSPILFEEIYDKLTDY
ncbi:hypothetical protein B296_00002930 [Ensete ventricosum]|uniref:Retrotransposon Copia-like N-terminal domain-containing protein n=1 Tax=Ensete ventricosum TaxID=4639 RepID=A0A427BA22_ENSVE|nr:hypothetical protein B296_00002930 [Ensete ventricosum]